MVRGSDLHGFKDAIIGDIEAIEMKVDLCKPEVGLMQIVIRVRCEQVLEHRLALVSFLIRDQVSVEVSLSYQDQIHDIVLQEERVLCTEKWL